MDGGFVYADGGFVCADGGFAYADGGLVYADGGFRLLSGVEERGAAEDCGKFFGFLLGFHETIFYICDC